MKDKLLLTNNPRILHQAKTQHHQRKRIHLPRKQGGTEPSKTTNQNNETGKTETAAAPIPGGEGGPMPMPGSDGGQMPMASGEGGPMPTDANAW
ncbi:MAG: hypothetical protein CM15mP62_24290 [Rhodospirillaceae bacterium]|nr:MAG: hypothetical protein CM15mP62_24290 [Rhodospirillaceae bacterium]